MENLTYRQASRFLDMATCGIRKGQVEGLMQSDRKTWIEHQISLPMSSHVEQVQRQISERSASAANHAMRVAAWFDLALWGEDQLRQRMAFALSQLLVVSDEDTKIGNSALETAGYYDLLSRHAFGNYRDLLYDVTRSPVMGHYLTMVNNKSEAASGSLPDENYAREILQLFSIGLYELRRNGELMLDGNGEPIETYDDSDIANLARIFTGWVKNNQSMSAPMITKDSDHDVEAKTFLGHEFPPGVGAEAELQRVLDILIAHPNTAPFVSKFLITRFVTSNPRPAYVKRVSSVFRHSGGDLGQVITAILTDTEALVENSARVAKLREPILAMTYFYRALDARPGEGTITYNPMNYKETFNQYPLGAPSVFNFFSPVHSPQGILRDQGLFAPELEIITWEQLVNTGNVFYNTMRNNSYDTNNKSQKRLYLQHKDLVDVAEQEALEPLLTMMANRFLHGQLSAELRSCIVPVYESRQPGSKHLAVRDMLFLILLSSDFQVQG